MDLVMNYVDSSIIILENHCFLENVFEQGPNPALTKLLNNRLPVRVGLEIGGPSPEEITICFGLSEFMRTVLENGSYDAFVALIKNIWYKIADKYGHKAKSPESDPLYLSMKVNLGSGKSIDFDLGRESDSDTVKMDIAQEAFDYLKKLAELENQDK